MTLTAVGEMNMMKFVESCSVLMLGDRVVAYTDRLTHIALTIKCQC